jgi:signal transduction histidine kinase
MKDLTPYLEALADHFATRRDAILESWRRASLADPSQHTAGALTRTQFNDHIPQVLIAFERKLRSQPGGSRAAQAEEKLQDEEMKHGQQRWQQGYRLPELMREWGHLHISLAAEIDTFATGSPPWGVEPLIAAHRELTHLVNQGISESVDQFARMERSEAAGRVRDLEYTIAQLQRLEHRRSQLIHQAVHDLRGDVQTVRNVADLLRDPQIADGERLEFAGMLQEGVDAVGKMLSDLMDLARLEAGHEHRAIEPFDAGALLLELCRVARPTATVKQLYLRTDGPTSLPVEGDAHRVRRLLQNLLFNALKYTVQGGVVVSWGREKEQWWLSVKDTGPGLMAGPGAPLAINLREATATAREADLQAAQKEGRTSPVLDQKQAGTTTPAPGRQQVGEGIGLSIVKRLCDLLDASLELVSSSESGTTLRVLFPVSYRPPG